MPFTGTLRWIAPAPAGHDTLADGRVWRWTAAEAPLPHAAESLRRAPPGFAEPGFALFDAAGHPRLALGRHLRAATDGSSYEQSLLLPAGRGAWAPGGVALHTRAGAALRDVEGRAQAVWTRPEPPRREPFDPRDRVEISGHRLRPEAAVPGRGGFFGALLGYGCAGVRFVAEGDGRGVGEAVSPGVRAWRGDVGVPVEVRWDGDDVPFALAALALVVTTVIDATDDRGG